MLYFWLILGALVLFFSFLLLTAFEEKRGTRVFHGVRSRLDAHTVKAVSVLKTADPLDFLIRGARSLFGHVFHDIMNVLWATVRMLERTLASTVRKLRTMRHHPERTETNSTFVKSISDHKETLRAEPSVEEKREDRVG